jgi:tRNA (cmo5U34)-methyltransferase
MNSFDFSEVENFDDHISRSIPMLPHLDTILNRLMFDFAQAGTAVIDIGCSTGRLLRKVDKRADVWYVGVDRDMEPEPCEGVEFMKGDVLQAHLYSASVIVSVFTAQFMSYRDRAEFFQICHDTLVVGGVLLVAEKLHSNDRRLDNSLAAQLMTFKRETFTDREIVDKAVALAPVMHQQTEAGLMRELNAFSSVDPIWRSGNFGCYAAIK